MTKNDIKDAVKDALKEASFRKPPLKYLKQNLEFSKKLIIFVSAIFATAWGVVLYAWFAGREIPWQLVEIVNWLYIATFGMYCGKSAYENGCKIKEGEWYE